MDFQTFGVTLLEDSFAVCSITLTADQRFVVFIGQYTREGAKITGI